MDAIPQQDQDRFAGRKREILPGSPGHDLQLQVETAGDLAQPGPGADGNDDDESLDPGAGHGADAALKKGEPGAAALRTHPPVEGEYAVADHTVSPGEAGSAAVSNRV